MKFNRPFFILLVGLALQIQSFAQPIVSNGRAEQRSGTKLVDIYYDLSGATGTDEVIEVLLSDDAGVTYTLPIESLSGDVGLGVTNGTDKHIVWDALQDLPSFVSQQMRIKVVVGPIDIVPMVKIAAGSFSMGDNLDRFIYAPVHTVELSAYKIGETEVTWGQWQEVRDWAVSNGYTDLSGVGAGKGLDHPAQSVSWYDVVKWCNAASEKVGLEPVYLVSDGGVVYRTGEVSPYMDYSKSGYRLPTEAEWERAARGGLEGKRFPWGDTISHAEANYYARPNSGSYDVNGSDGYHPDYDEGGYPYTSPAGSFAANGYGLYDVAGNVGEWCGDWYGRNYYGNSPDSDPAGPDSGSDRVIRGGDLYYYHYDCRVAYRYSGPPSVRNGGIGFRLARRL